jgi:hypothetical protein
MCIMLPELLYDAVDECCLRDGDRVLVEVAGDGDAEGKFSGS